MMENELQVLTHSSDMHTRRRVFKNWRESGIKPENVEFQPYEDEPWEKSRSYDHFVSSKQEFPNPCRFGAYKVLTPAPKSNSKLGTVIVCLQLLTRYRGTKEIEYLRKIIGMLEEEIELRESKL